MKKEDWFGVAYVSIWVIIWGTFGSLIDYPLLINNIYEASSLGQLTTFLVTAIISITIAVALFSFFSKKLLK